MIQSNISLLRFLREKLAISLACILFATGCVAESGQTGNAGAMKSMNLSSGHALSTTAVNGSITVSLEAGNNQTSQTIEDNDSTGAPWQSNGAVAMLEENRNRPDAELASLFVIQDTNRGDGTSAIQEWRLIETDNGFDLTAGRQFSIPVKRLLADSKLMINADQLRLTLYVSGSQGNRKDKSVIEYDIGPGANLNPVKVIRTR